MAKYVFMPAQYRFVGIVADPALEGKVNELETRIQELIDELHAKANKLEGLKQQLNHLDSTIQTIDTMRKHGIIIDANSSTLLK